MQSLLSDMLHMRMSNLQPHLQCEFATSSANASPTCCDILPFTLLVLLSCANGCCTSTFPPSRCCTSALL